MINLIDQLKPDCLIISQNEYWPNMISHSLAAQIPIYYVGTYVAKNHWWLHPLFRFVTNPLKQVDTIFLQDKDSKTLMENAGFVNVELAGNPRIDQVIDNRIQDKNYPIVESFCGNKPIVICGSTLLSDDKLLLEAAKHIPHVKFVIIPHDPSSFKLSDYPSTSDICMYSSYTDRDQQKQVLIFDAIGELKYLYKFAALAYVGGGFDEGVHNTLEPAVFQIPILSGPEIKKFNHARAMSKLNVLFLINNIEELIESIKLNIAGLDESTQKELSLYLSQHAGATQRIIRSIAF